MITICATGAVTPMGNSEEEIWDNLCKKQQGRLNQKIPYTSVLPGKVKRRINRFADMATTASEHCFQEVQKKQETEKGRIGCIFNTAYGPLETNIEFAKQIIQDDPDACSPILFSNTVHNACLGTIAIHLGITGPSTMLLGSNHLWMSKQMLAENKADVMLAGAVEEYNEDLANSLSMFQKRTDAYGDGAVVFALKLGEGKETDVKIKEMLTFNLGVTPFEQAAWDKSILTKILNAKIKEFNVDVVITNQPDTELGKAEGCVLQDNAPEVCRIDRFYEYFGNGLGTDMSMKLLLAKLLLQKGSIPECLSSGEVMPKKIESIAVLASDITGNYYLTIVEK